MDNEDYELNYDFKDYVKRYEELRVDSSNQDNNNLSVIKNMIIEEYNGYTYFWNHEYRHYLRDTTDNKRKDVLKQFLDNNLELAGESSAHLEIIKNILEIK